MPIDITMPALSPTMETGTLAKWLVKVGDSVKSGDLLAEIETDKATMEVESIDEGTVAELLVSEGTEGVPVGQVIMRLAGEGEAAGRPSTSLGMSEIGNAEPSAKLPPVTLPQNPTPLIPSEVEGRTAPAASPAAGPPAPVEGAVRPSTSLGMSGSGTGVSEGVDMETKHTDGVADSDRINASPLARRIAEARGLDLSSVRGTGPGGRIVKADVEGAPVGAAAAALPAADPSVKAKGAAAAAPTPAAAPKPAAAPAAPAPTAAPAPVTGDTGIPHETVKLSGMRKTIARRLTESKQQVPHIYLTVDIRLDALLKLRGELNAALAAQKVKLSVNDLLIKALGKALMLVPACNVSFGGDTLIKYSRADISVAVSIPGGLITPIIADAGSKAVSAISTEMTGLAERAKAGKLQPHEYQGGTASLSNMGMFGIKQFEAVINPPQGMIMAIGAGEKRPFVVDDALAIATIMSATGSFDHRAIDGADGAQLMAAFKALVESPLGLVA